MHERPMSVCVLLSVLVAFVYDLADLTRSPDVNENFSSVIQPNIHRSFLADTKTKVKDEF